MKRALLLAFLFAVGCGPGWTGKCHPALMVGLGIPTGGIYPMAVGPSCGAQAEAQWEADEVHACVSQGGDPANCRAAVYGDRRSPQVVVNQRAPVCFRSNGGKTYCH